jgi:hypothetical protein
MGYETESFLDIIILSKSGKVPDEIPAHYWKFCYSLRRKAKGLKVPAIGWQDAARLTPVICLPYKP